MRWKQVLTGMLLGAVLLAAWWAASRRPGVSPVRVPSVSVEVADAGVRDVVSAVEAREVADAGLWLRATLEGTQPFTGEAPGLRDAAHHAARSTAPRSIPVRTCFQRMEP
ncbi:MAG: hypothetical protein EOO72_14525, partial [Myxococcaceae bacterium]